jgi:hypothetical protein
LGGGCRCALPHLPWSSAMALTPGGEHAQALDARVRECAQGAWYTVRWVVAERGGCPAQPRPEPGIPAFFGRSLIAQHGCCRSARRAVGKLPLRNRPADVVHWRPHFFLLTHHHPHAPPCVVPCRYVVSLLGGKRGYLRAAPPAGAVYEEFPGAAYEAKGLGART